MKAELCPVCMGKGKILRNGDWVTERGTGVCHGCGGRGWVEVERDKEVVVKRIVNKESYNRCPSCGGDRNSPAGTGCPKSSHYGNLSGV